MSTFTTYLIGLG